MRSRFLELRLNGLRALQCRTIDGGTITVEKTLCTSNVVKGKERGVISLNGGWVAKLIVLRMSTECWLVSHYPATSFLDPGEISRQYAEVIWIVYCFLLLLDRDTVLPCRTNVTCCH